MDFKNMSDEELEKMAGGHDDYGSMSDEQLEKLANPPTKTESAIRGAGQGLSLGFWDELAGAGEEAGRAVGVKGLGNSDWSQIGFTKPTIMDDAAQFGDAYTEGRDKWRAEDAAASKENPMSYKLGEGAGMLASPVNKLTAGMGLAEGGAILGGASGLGNSEAKDISRMALDTGLGAATGLVLGKTIDGASPAIQSLISKSGSGVSDLAERFAGRALGAERGTIKKLGLDKVKAAGRQALDEGVISPLASTDDMIARNEALKARGGEMMGNAYKAIDDAGASTFNPLDVATKVDDQIGGFYRSPINRGETNQLENTLESILMRGDGNIPLQEAQSLKQELGKVANWKNNLNVTDKERMAREAYGIVSSHIDDAVQTGSSTIEKAGLSDILAKGKDLYSKGSTAEQLLNNKQAREQGNKILGLTDWGVLGAGGVGAAATGGASIPGTMALMGAKKGLEKYGSQNAALGLDKISKALLKSPEMNELLSRNPTAFNTLVESMEGKISSRIPQKVADEQSKPYDQNALLQKVQGTKYSQVLQNAAQKGDKAFSAAHFVLQSRDPEYRKAIMDQDEFNDQ